jgi:uncharacterized protein YndB with AHSA1/START domain
MTGYVATAETVINASTADVWTALTDPAAVSQYMFGTQLETDWQQGSPIVWKGEYEGKPYEDKGEILEVVPGQRLVVTHFSPLGGQEDKPENYHTLTYMLGAANGRTHLTLSQDNNASEDEAEHSRAMWQTMLDGLKGVAEQSAG